MIKNTTPTVDAITEMSFKGNIIPHHWYKTITKITAKGKTKPYLEAILILSDICYWYKSTDVRDEATNEICEIKKKFAGDKLQKSYQKYMDFFGFTWAQAKNAFDFLVKQGLITREFRNFLSGQTYLTNVMYVEPCADRVREISHPAPLKLRRGGSNFATGGVVKLGRGEGKIGHTYTENNKQITNTENTHRVIRSPKTDKNQTNNIKTKDTIPLECINNNIKENPVSAPPTLDELKGYCADHGYNINLATKMFKKFNPLWIDKDQTPIRDWKKLVDSWAQKDIETLKHRAGIKEVLVEPVRPSVFSYTDTEIVLQGTCPSCGGVVRSCNAECCSCYTKINWSTPLIHSIINNARLHA